SVVTTAIIHYMPSSVRLLNEADRVRVLVLLITAQIGFFAALLGLCLPFTDRLRNKFAAGPDEWGNHRGALFLCGGLLLGGLVLMFIGLQLARRLERTRTGLRRLLYGYNAVLGALLVALGLGLVNALAYSKVQWFSWLGHTVDWTSS